jgi:hypothetical protein
MAVAGAILLIIGIAALRSDQPALNYLFLGFALALVGVLLWNKLRPRTERIRRFSRLRKKEDQKQEDRRRRTSREDTYYD